MGNTEKKTLHVFKNGIAMSYIFILINLTIRMKVTILLEAAK